MGFFLHEEQFFGNISAHSLNDTDLGLHEDERVEHFWQEGLVHAVDEVVLFPC